MVQDASRMTICTECGRKLPPGAKFCGYDGTRLNPNIGTTDLPGGAQLPKYCPACKKTYPLQAMFCPVDAARLATVTMTSTIPGDSRHWEEVAAAASRPDLSLQTNLVGKTIDYKYLVESVLGEGGMAIVYKCFHKQMERPVVIKVMQGWLLSSKNSLERFEREYKITAKLNHPNIVSVYDVGFLNGNEPYIVMEYIKGEALADRIARSGDLPLPTVAKIAIQICRGLQEAHAQNIIHRDLKPDNILLQEKSDRPDWVKIVDFGISHFAAGESKRLTKTGRMVGTPEYISPEQLRDQPIDARTDLYSFGIILYEMLAGTVPFTAETAEAVLMKHLLSDVPSLKEYRDDIADDSPFGLIVHKLLQKNPDDRYDSAAEVRIDIEKALNQSMTKRDA
jgi:eukaryotic-like serine/threonine-protein kinase